MRRLGRRAVPILHAGGAYSHLGCQSRSHRSHRGKPHRGKAAPGSSLAIQGKEARTLAGCRGPGPGRAPRRGVLSTGNQSAKSVVADRARMSQLGHPRPSLFVPRPALSSDPEALSSSRLPSSRPRRPSFSRRRTVEPPCILWRPPVSRSRHLALPPCNRCGNDKQMCHGDTADGYSGHVRIGLLRRACSRMLKAGQDCDFRGPLAVRFH